MHRVFLYLLLPAWLCLGVAYAQFNSFPPGVFSNKAARDPAAGGAYVGPGDVASGAAAYISCTRAYTAAYATGAGNACDLVRASDSTTCTMKFAANGNADVSVGTPCTGAVTVTSFCNGTTCVVSKAYDQTGNGKDFTQSTNANRPTFDPAGAKVMVFGGSHQLTNAAIGSIAQIFSLSAVAKRTSGTSTACILCTISTNSDLLFHGANTAAIIWNGSGFSDETGVADGSCHYFEANGNATSTVFMIDGTPHTEAQGSGGIGDNYEVGGSGGTGGSFPLTGTIREVIIYASDQSSLFASLSSNQSTYGGC